MTRWIAVVLLGMVGIAIPVGAQVASDVPEALKDVGIDEHFDVQVPLDLEFKNEQGETVRLGQYFDGEHPVILTLNYYRCPMLCGLQLNGFMHGLKDLNWEPGERYQVVTISIDPLETPKLAAAKKKNYIDEMGKEGAGEGWHFLTGGEPNIKKVADAVGFRYHYDKETGQYAHAAALMVLTPEGHVARYLYGIEYPASKLKFALLEASEGDIGSPIDRLVLYCFHYDATDRQYTPVAMNIMRAGGGLTAIVLGLAIGAMWFRERSRKKNSTRRTTET